MKAPLAGVRVLDFGRYIAGPYCAALLADYGADVIRVEKRSGSEDRYNTPLTPTGDGAMFLQMNRNKRSITLDPLSAGGREVVRALVATSDVVVANLPTPALRAMEIDYASLRKVRPDIILTHVSAFGSAGPLSRNVGFDGVGQAMCGSLYMTGIPDQPYRAMVPWVDFGTALHCAFGTLLAVMRRRETGEGQVVEGTLLGTALTFANALLIEQAVLGVDRVPSGNRGQLSAPADLFRARDGWILCQVVGQPLYERWAKLMGEAEWLADPRYRDDTARGAHGELISGRMARWCAEKSTEDIIAILGKAQIPCAPVLSPQQALDHPQTRALGLLQPLDYPGLPRPAPVGTAPLSMSAISPVERRAPPLLGAHTEEVLRSVGYDDASIARLRAEAAI